MGVSGIAGLAGMAPGPELAAALAAVDPAGVAVDELFVVVRAQARQVAFEQGRLLGVLARLGEVAERPVPLRGQRRRRVGEAPDEYAADEVGWALAWSRSFAHGQLLLGHALVGRFRTVYEAVLAGRLDVARAKVFVDVLSDLPDERVAVIVARLLGPAEGLTVAKLRQRLRYHAVRADPGLARRRYERSVADRDVWWRSDSEGTATIVLSNLPVGAAARAMDFVDRLARAARASGQARTLKMLRVDAALALLAGETFTVVAPVDAVTAAADARAVAQGRAGDADDPPPGDLPQWTRDVGWSVDDLTDPPPDPPWAPHPPGSADPPGVTHPPGSADPPWMGESGRPAAVGGVSGEASLWWEEVVAEPDDRVWAEPVPIGRGGFDAALPAPAGPVPDGSRCCRCQGVKPAERRGEVHIEIKASTLICLDDDPALIPGWGPVIADIARQFALDQRRNPRWLWRVTDEQGRLLSHGHTSRRPSAVERTHVRLRDRTCRAPGCTAPAMNCDQDHRQQYQHGGPSHRSNMCSLCVHHHVLRHEYGYTHDQIALDTHLWTSPNGLVYLVAPGDDLRLTSDLDDIDWRHLLAEEPPEATNDDLRAEYPFHTLDDIIELQRSERVA